MIKLLIVDDSPLMRRLLGELFASEGDFEVAVARDGVEALAMLDDVAPDVITLDIQMPQMDGLACLDRIMLVRPTPVVMVSATTQQGAEQTLRALELGAVDFIAKPSGAVSLRMQEWGPPLVATIRTAARARIRRARRLADRVRQRTAPLLPTPPQPVRVARPHTGALSADGLVVLGTSTGGPPALEAVLSRLPGDFPWPIVVAQHMPASFTGPLARRLDGLTALVTAEVTSPTRLLAGRAYVGRGDADMIVSRRPDGVYAQSAPSDATFRWHPSVDRLVDTAMSAYAPEQLIGVLMTGMGDDGAAAMTRLNAAGGRTLAEAEDTAVVWGMPGELVRAGGAGTVASLGDIAGWLTAAVRPR
ncbi:chemotaxis-specific protein-glutamate methyltransferase CheB [Phenylobacterium sp.]|uniref:chemotaxis-specific protein-glutamate methyltransferase CheB n=1 Tax=Phenylobacterium sp. TaxID=1871053 RepID=UPI002733AC16|nr:chemotaxis-specific protein-glutamate methyltransferase CheB [Phenylobacterium sp.]MDP3660351.1 chemotaxis-specific protein-glutamate methyltransferase CheB [Phenylobacterium sp.]